MLQYRAEFDADVTFRNGGGLQAQRFRVDVPHGDVTEAEIAALFVAACGLLMVDRVTLSGIRVFGEPHSGTRGGPSDASAGPPRPAAPTTWMELSHVVPARSELTPPTALTSPFAGAGDGADLAGLPLERLAGLPAVVVRTAGTGVRGVDVAALAPLDPAGRAVLLHTGGDRHWATPRYARDAPYLTAAGATWLAEHGAALVGIDAAGIDDPASGDRGTRPARGVLLAAGIPVVEHLTGLANLPPTGARFTAAPPRFAGTGTFPVRAYAAVPAIEPHDHRRSAGWLPASGA